MKKKKDIEFHYLNPIHIIPATILAILFFLLYNLMTLIFSFPLSFLMGKSALVVKRQEHLVSEKMKEIHNMMSFNIEPKTKRRNKHARKRI